MFPQHCLRPYSLHDNAISHISTHLPQGMTARALLGNATVLEWLSLIERGIDGLRDDSLNLTLKVSILHISKYGVNVPSL